MSTYKGPFLICALLLTSAMANAAYPPEITIAMNRVSVKFLLYNGGMPEYSVDYNGKPLIKPSRLGFTLAEAPSLDSAFEILSTDSSSVDETWDPVWGETKHIRNHYRQLIVRLKETTALHRLLNITFRVFEDGLGFRYEFPGQPNLKYFIISDELT